MCRRQERRLDGVIGHSDTLPVRLEVTCICNKKLHKNSEQGKVMIEFCFRMTTLEARWSVDKKGGRENGKR